MIIGAQKNMNKSSWISWISAGEFLLAFLLFFFPDWAKIFLFVLPLALLYGEGISFFYKYFKKRGGSADLIIGIFFVLLGSLLFFIGRKVFMIGIAVLMLFATLFFFKQCVGKSLFEKIILCSAALLSLVWMVLIIFKGLHLFWSVREYLSLYFLCVSRLSAFCRK